MGMVDLMREKDQGSSSSSSLSCDQDMDVSENNKKCCVDCKTTKTPLWRGGPAGPKSLCNACGIRYRKRRASLGLNKGPEKKKEKSSQSEPQSQPDNVTETIATTNKIDNVTETIATTIKIDSNDQDGVNGSTTATDGGGGFSESLKMNLMTLGKDLMLQRPSPAAPTVKKQRCRRRRELGEEEQAAVCLLAMSCGYVFG